jgi:Starch synthase catalytic domain
MSKIQEQMARKTLSKPSAFLEVRRAQLLQAVAESPCPRQRNAVQPDLVSLNSNFLPSHTLALVQALHAAVNGKSDALQIPQRRFERSDALPTKTSQQHAIVYIVAAEAAPYRKTGGLGDVVASLPVALAARGHRVMVVVPRYLTSERDHCVSSSLRDCDTWAQIELDGQRWVNYHYERRDGVDWVLVQHECFERPGGLYGNEAGAYEDNSFRRAIESGTCAASCVSTGCRLYSLT